jgi:hypothetical protein
MSKCNLRTKIGLGKAALADCSIQNLKSKIQNKMVGKLPINLE